MIYWKIGILEERFLRTFWVQKNFLLEFQYNFRSVGRRTGQTDNATIPRYINTSFVGYKCLECPVGHVCGVEDCRIQYEADANLTCATNYTEACLVTEYVLENVCTACPDGH